jgi:hypothetical protein
MFCDDEVNIFEVLIAATMKGTIFWDVTPCSLVKVYRHFEGKYCPHQAYYLLTNLLRSLMNPDD